MKSILLLCISTALLSGVCDCTGNFIGGGGGGGGGGQGPVNVSRVLNCHVDAGSRFEVPLMPAAVDVVWKPQPSG